MIQRRRAVCALGACLAIAAPASANDSIAGVGSGGLILGRTDAVFMDREDLFISMEEVRVDYVFENRSDKDVESIVAFPMPDIAASVYTMPMLPDDTSDNFLGFEVTIDGQKVEPKLEQRAFAVGVEITDDLKANGVPINPFTDPAAAALEKLPESVAADWVDRGIIVIDSYDEGEGMKHVRTPSWTLKSTYYWTSKFPKNKPVNVSHRYKPSVGASAGLSFYYDKGFQEPYSDYQHKYCIDEAFEKAIRKAADKNPDGYPQFSENRLHYVLTTGGNWALGTIGEFHLTVDKGDEKNIVSFCGKGVKKTGPTTFELTESQYYPARDIEVLILMPYEMAFEEDRAAGGVEGTAGSTGKSPAGRR